MSQALRKPISSDEFLAWEDEQPLRWEFDGYEPQAMTGGTSEHSAIQVNLAAALVTRLRGKPCRFFNNDLKIEVAGAIRYPDGFVVCTPVPQGAKLVSDPVVVFEVLSPSTQAVDRTDKMREYQATPSILRYVMLEQDYAMATVFARDGARWIGTVHYEDATLPMPEIGIDLPLAELYADVVLPGRPAHDSPVHDSPAAVV